MTKRQPLVEVLSGCETTNLELLGGKGAALARLVRDGRPVPATGVVTTEAYRLAVDGRAPTRANDQHNEDQHNEDQHSEDQHSDEEIDAWFCSLELPAPLRTAITDLAARVGTGGPVAVRSSATVEDLGESSFAGQYRSLLNVPSSDPDAVLEAVRQVWASLWHRAPVAYRHAFGIDDTDVAMAVVIMAMVPATTAGVVFTSDPDGRDGARIERVVGLGEALVSGWSTPEAWQVPVEVERRPALPSDVTRALDLAVEIADDAGVPQDVEWAAEGDRVYVVQARPITVLASDDGFDSAMDDHELTTEGIAEFVPGVVGPLQWDMNRLLLEEAYRSVLADLGRSERPDEDRDPTDIAPPIVRRVRGRVAIDLEQLRSISAGDGDAIEAAYFGESPSGANLGEDVSVTHSTRRPAQKRGSPGSRIAAELRSVATTKRVLEQADVVIRASQLIADRRPTLDRKTTSQLLRYRRRLLDLATRGLAAELGVAAAASTSFQRLEDVVTSHLGAERGRPLVQAATANTGVIRHHPDASAATFAGPTWAELGGGDVDTPRVQTAEAASGGQDGPGLGALIDELRSLPGWNRRRILTGQVVDVRAHTVRRLTRDVRSQLRRREEAKAAVFLLGGEIRRVHDDLGRRLVNDGVLPQVDAVELLSWIELDRAVRTGVVPTGDELRRRAGWLDRYDAEGFLPRRFVGEPTRTPTPLPAGDVLNGWAASPGRSTGTAVALRRPTDHLSTGDVLVAEATDASWSPLFLRAGAVVVERGGPLSHAAILARELGLPAVLNVEGATRALDGETVTVDGTQGVVVIENPVIENPVIENPVIEESVAEETQPLPTPAGDRPSTIDPFEGFDDSSFLVFVPAIMTVGLVFSMVSVVRDLFRWSGSKARERRARFEAESVAADVLGRRAPDPAALGLLSRPSYLVAGLSLLGGAAYVGIGSTANFLRDGGYVRDIGWLLAVSLALTVALGFLGGVSLMVFRSWPYPPTSALGALRSAPMTMTRDRRESGPSWALGVYIVAVGVALTLVTLVVATGRGAVAGIDRPILDWLVETAWLDRLDGIDPFGSTIVSIVFVAVIGLSGFRCRAMAWVFPAAFAASWIVGEIIRRGVGRQRPVGFGDLESYPSGHLVQAVFIAGLLPLALGTLFADRRIATLARAVLGVGVCVTALHRVHQQHHWPLDVVGGAALGLLVVLAAQWVLDHRRFHGECAGCPWSPAPRDAPWHGSVFSFAPRTVRRLDVAGVLLALGAAATLGVSTLTVGLPTDPEGYGLASSVLEPVQIGLACLVGVGGLVALVSRPIGAFLGALAACGLGLLASVQYEPVLSIALTLALMVPPVLIWLGWQAGETVGTISLLAILTTVVITTTAVGSHEIYDELLGPTHPSSLAAPLDSHAEWIWLGAVDDTSATVVAGGLPSDSDAWIHTWPAATSPPAEPAATSRTGSLSMRTDEDGVARFVLSDLEPGQRVAYAVTSTSTAPGSADASFVTHESGAHDLVIVAGSCARSGSNGAVFDAIVAEEPDLYLAIGDLHYSNVASSNPDRHRDEYARALSQNGQATLFSTVPTAYVWDDHDYGPNDADSSSSSRGAVSLAYRQAVPHYGVDPDPEASIGQAFTVGRVRIVMTDTRSQRDASSMLGEEQLEWFLNEVTAAASTHAVVIWANPTPWITDDASDTWADHDDERRAILDALRDVDNLVMVSGDAHMVAIDDGSNSGFGIHPGFPVLHAAALDRPGSVKGGPYSHGAFPGGGQYGRIEVIDDGGATVTVRLSGHDWTGQELVHLERTYETSPDR